MVCICDKCEKSLVGLVVFQLNQSLKEPNTYDLCYNCYDKGDGIRKGDYTFYPEDEVVPLSEAMTQKELVRLKRTHDQMDEVVGKVAGLCDELETELDPTHREQIAAQIVEAQENQDRLNKYMKSGGDQFNRLDYGSWYDDKEGEGGEEEDTENAEKGVSAQDGGVEESKGNA